MDIKDLSYVDNIKVCENCADKDCVNCDKQDRFIIQTICDEECIMDNLTEEMYTKSDLKLISDLMNKLIKR